MAGGDPSPALSSLTLDVRRIVFLIHGTFASNATWILPESGLGQKLADLGGTQVIPFRWSGANSISGRLRAARDLNGEIRRAATAHPAAELHLVAHSHGGNVIRYAISSAIGFGGTYLDRIKTCVFLGTPFIVHRPRNLIVLKAVVTATGWLLALNILTTLVGCLAGAGGAQSPDMAEAEAEFVQAMAPGLGLFAKTVALLFSAVSLLVFWRLRALLASMRGEREVLFFERPTNSYGHRNHDVVISYQGDEARQLLGALGWPTRMQIAALRLLLSGAAQALRINKKMIWGGVLAVVAVAILAAGSSAPEAVLLLPVWPAWHFLALAWSGIAAALLLLGIYLTNRLLQAHPASYGSEPTVNYLAFDIGISMLPPLTESRRVTHYHLQALEPRVFWGGLRHSGYYEHEACHDIVVRAVTGAVPEEDHVVRPSPRRSVRRGWRMLGAVARYAGFLVLAPGIAALGSILLLTAIASAVSVISP